MKYLIAGCVATLVSHLFMDAVNDTFTHHDRWYVGAAVLGLLLIYIDVHKEES